MKPATTPVHRIRTLSTGALVAAALVAVATAASAAEPLGCQAAKLSAQVNHARCSVRCGQRPPERVQACQTRCDERFTRKISVLSASPICTGQTSGSAANNGICDLQLLKAAWKQVKCYLRCNRLAQNSDTFDSSRCNDRCESQFDRAKARVLAQPVCSRHSGLMPSIN
ncbi:MAG: hypothetical protein N3C12_08535 [Candidatus Binatia bacterium]|nr:hypothetical protein [Candidatus Binatia bacterium]